MWKKYIRSKILLVMLNINSPHLDFKQSLSVQKCNYEKKLFAENNTTDKFYTYVKSQTAVK